MSSAEYIRQLLTQSSAGPTGAQGPVGPRGPTGATGPTGTQGIQGVPGVSGDAGVTGTDGPTGPTGENSTSSIGVFPSPIFTGTLLADDQDIHIIGKKIPTPTRGAFMVCTTDDLDDPLKKTVTGVIEVGTEIMAMDFSIPTGLEYTIAVSKGTFNIYIVSADRVLQPLTYANALPFTTTGGNHLIGIRSIGVVFGVLSSNGEFATFQITGDTEITWGPLLTTGASSPVGLGVVSLFSMDAWFTFDARTTGTTEIFVRYSDFTQDTITVPSNLTNIFITSERFAYVGGSTTVGATTTHELYQLTDTTPGTLEAVLVSEYPDGPIEALQYSINGGGFWVALYYDSGSLFIQKNPSSNTLIDQPWQSPIEISTTATGKVSVACGGAHVLVGTYGTDDVGTGVNLYSLNNDLTVIIDSTPPGPVRLRINDILIPLITPSGTKTTYQLTSADRYQTFIMDSAIITQLNLSTDRISLPNFHVNVRTENTDRALQANLGSLYTISNDPNFTIPNVIGNFNGTTLDFY